MIVARQSLRLGDALELDGGLQHHAFVQLADHAALDFLPWRLACRVFIAARRDQVVLALLQFLVVDQDIGRALSQVDTQMIAGASRVPARH